MRIPPRFSPYRRPNDSRVEDRSAGEGTSSRRSLASSSSMMTENLPRLRLKLPVSEERKRITDALSDPQTGQRLRTPELIDNSASLARIGAGEALDMMKKLGATIPSAPPARPDTALHAALRRSLDIPGEPCIQFPPDDPPGTRAARSLAVNWLLQGRALFADLHDEGLSPDTEPDAVRKFDKLAAPAIIAALNARDSNLGMRYLHSLNQHLPNPTRAAYVHDFGSVDARTYLASAPAGSSSAILDTEDHTLALHFKIEDRAVGRLGSVLVFEPSPAPANVRMLGFAALAEQLALPAGWKLTAVPVPLQKSLRSCRIFSYSLALKAHDQREALDQLHHRFLSGAQTGLAMEDIVSVGEEMSESESESSLESGERFGRRERRNVESVVGQTVLKPSQVLGPAFMKHAQSRNAVEQYLAERSVAQRDAMSVSVNKHGQTLLQRHDAHRVFRMHKNDQGMRSAFEYSASIELKRIQFIDLAIKHLMTADPSQVTNLARTMLTIDRHWVDSYRT